MNIIKPSHIFRQAQYDHAHAVSLSQSRTLREHNKISNKINT